MKNTSGNLYTLLLGALFGKNSHAAHAQSEN
jgi:hypothetical protein